MENMWEYIFEKELNLDPKNMNILLTDSPLNLKENKQQLAEIMFEKFRVESLSIVNTAVLSLFSTGKTSGIVVEAGEGVSYTVPVFEGYALPHAIHKIDIAGQDITNQLINHLKADGVPVTHSHFEYVREMKEQMCSVATRGSKQRRSCSTLNCVGLRMKDWPILHSEALRSATQTLGSISITTLCSQEALLCCQASMTGSITK